MQFEYYRKCLKERVERKSALLQEYLREGGL